jgi:alpha-L-arabinofuranosidase
MRRMRNIRSSRLGAVTGAVVTAAAAAVAATGGSPAQAANTPAAAPPTATSTVAVQAGQTRAVLGRASLGADTPPWNGALTSPGAPARIGAAGIRELEFNGGPMSDLYHWRTGSLDPLAAQYHDTDLKPAYSFDQWARLAKASHQAMFVHVNYGTGTPAEAAAWVRYANRVKHYGVRDWEIGEEVYGDGAIAGIPVFEPDGHPAAQRTAQGFADNALAYIKAMKAADPSIRIGIPILATPDTKSPEYAWDATVLKTLAPHADFVDEHWYPVFGAASASTVLATVNQVKPTFAALRALISADAHGHRVAIHVGETNSQVSGSALTSSITNALYLGETVPTLLENRAEAVDWWALYTGLQDSGSAGTGDLGLLSTGSQDCLSTAVCEPPVNTPYPAYYGLQLTSALTTPGSRLVTVTSGDAAVNAHAAVRPDGTLVVLAVNTDAAQAKPVRLSISGYRAAPVATELTYGAGSHAISRTRTPARGTITLAPSSLTELVLRPA